MTLELHPKDSEAYYKWLDSHAKADALIIDDRTKYVIKVEYHCPQSMYLTEQLNIWKEIATLGEIE